jgi:hypothetical protein
MFMVSGVDFCDFSPTSDFASSLMMMRAPSAARALAMAKPMPPVQPVTRASLFSSLRFMV